MSERGRVIEVESLEEFDELVERHAQTMDGWHLQGLDLTERGDVLRRLDASGSLFLGCGLAEADEASLRDRGALIFPVVPEVPVDMYRASLYSPSELYDGLDSSYQETTDARIYAWSRQGSHDLRATLAQALHDHAIDDALTEAAAGLDLVGMMGGHALPRAAGTYADAAHLARTLTREGLCVCTGGGPGAMEAANLGAYLSKHEDDALPAALEALAQTPSFTPSIAAWARSAFDVRDRWPNGADSFGIPTWHYGHEPPNVFASRIAKYFKNAIREDILLHLCTAGIVFLPGAGGTVQEIFQDACENYYADPSTVAPMVLVGREYWTEVVPAWPLLHSLAKDRAMAPVVHLVDDLADVAPLLAG